MIQLAYLVISMLWLNSDFTQKKSPVHSMSTFMEASCMCLDLFYRKNLGKLHFMLFSLNS